MTKKLIHTYIVKYILGNIVNYALCTAIFVRFCLNCQTPEITVPEIYHGVCHNRSFIASSIVEKKYKLTVTRREYKLEKSHSNTQIID